METRSPSKVSYRLYILWRPCLLGLVTVCHLTLHRGCDGTESPVGGGGKEEGWRRRSQGIGNEPGIGRPRSPCEMRESLRQVERALGEVRKPKCQRMEG